MIANNRRAEFGGGHIIVFRIRGLQTLVADGQDTYQRASIADFSTSVFDSEQTCVDGSPDPYPSDICLSEPPSLSGSLDSLGNEEALEFDLDNSPTSISAPADASYPRAYGKIYAIPVVAAAIDMVLQTI